MNIDYLKTIIIPAMTWENFGTVWKIDHIIPIDSYDLTDEKQLYECFNYRNMRPIHKGKYLEDYNKLKQYDLEIRNNKINHV